MKFDWRVAASGAGLLIAAGAVVGGVALAQPAATHPHRAPAAVQTTTSTPAPTATVAATTSAAPATTAPAVSPSTHHIVRPKETTVSEPSVSESVPVQVIPVTSDSAGRAGNAPPPPPISTPPQQLPSMTVPNNTPAPSASPSN